jgi:plasmid replication initiation protein
MKQAQGPFVVLQTIEQESKYGGTMTVITMANSKGEIVHTYVDPSNKNYVFWQDIIDLQDKNFGIIVDNLKYKTKDGEIATRWVKHWNVSERLINADSKVKIVYTTEDQQEVIDRLAEVLE